jgi:hypothetical protein
METAIVLGLIYVTTLVLNFVKKDWPTTFRTILVRGHIVFVGLTIIQIILLTTGGLTFRGIYFDRIVFWGLFISGGLFFALFKGRTILVSLILPETYYKDHKFELRNNSGPMAPRQIILIEKNWLTEKEIGKTEYRDGEIKGIEILGATTDSINARLNYGRRTELVTFKTGR